MLYNKQKQNKTKNILERVFLQTKTPPQMSRNLRGQLLLLFWPEKKYPTDFFFFLNCTRAEVSSVHCLTSRVSRSSISTCFWSCRNHRAAALRHQWRHPTHTSVWHAGFPIGRDAVMSKYINELIKQNACGLLFGVCARSTDTHVTVCVCVCVCFLKGLLCLSPSWDHNEKSLHMRCLRSDM